MKELGWEQNSENVWVCDSKDKKTYKLVASPSNKYYGQDTNYMCAGGDHPDWGWYYAPTLTEILEELPDRTEIYKMKIEHSIGKFKTKYLAFVKKNKEDISHENPAESAGLLWCKLRYE